MSLNLPVPYLLNERKIMFAGVGGGYDIFGALPLVHSLDRVSNGFVLVNNSPSKSFSYRRTTEDDFPECVLNINADHLENRPSFYTVGRHGVQTLKEAYAEIVEKEGIEVIIAIDGGVDSLMHGDEENSGTVLEDFIGLAALSELDVPTKLLVSLGFGTETEEDINHYRALENMAQLVKSSSFLGCCALTNNMYCYDLYKQTCELAFSQGRKSHIQTKIISAVEGSFGDSNLYGDVDARLAGKVKNNCFISPLSSIYWFFNLDGVIRQNLVLNAIKSSRTFTDALMLYRQSVQITRSKEMIPL